jgi:hypothetical protein
MRAAGDRTGDPFPRPRPLFLTAADFDDPRDIFDPGRLRLPSLSGLGCP